MIIFLVVAVIFALIVIFAVPRDKEVGTNRLTFEVPREIIINERPGMDLVEREVKRRRLLNRVFQMGFQTHVYLQKEHEVDRKLGNGHR